MSQPERVPQEGEIWHRIGMRERVRIGRVWDTADGETAVRCHPCHGGKWWWTILPAFLEHMEFESERA